MTTEFLWNLIRIFQEMDEHVIILKIFIDFDQNSVSHCYYITIQMTLEFFKNSTTKEFLWYLSWIWSIRILQEIDDPNQCENFHIFRSELLLSNNSDDIRILQELYDQGIIVKIFIYFDQNSFSQPYYPRIQMTLEFFVWAQNSSEISPGFDQNS